MAQKATRNDFTKTVRSATHVQMRIRSKSESKHIMIFVLYNFVKYTLNIKISNQCFPWPGIQLTSQDLKALTFYHFWWIWTSYRLYILCVQNPTLQVAMAPSVVDNLGLSRMTPCHLLARSRVSPRNPFFKWFIEIGNYRLRGLVLGMISYLVIKF